MNNTIISQENTITQHDNMITQQNNKIEQQGNIITQHGTTLETFDSDIKILNSAFVIKDGVLTGLNKVIIDDLETNSLNAKYANIDFSNIKIAAIEKLFTDSGIIKDLIVSEGKITGELVGVTIKGDLIEGNTIKADRLVVKGENGLYYKLNLDSLGEVTVSSDEKYQNGLDGSVIIAKSITAEKVAVNDLVAFDATIGGFNITNNSIYSGAKNSADNTTRGIYMDKTGQFSIGDSNNFLRYILDPNKRTYKLEISARSIVFGASNQNIEEVINDIQETTKKAVKTVNVLYALSDSSTEAPSTGWSAVAPNWTENKYMWQKTVITYIDDEVLESNPTCIQGAKGDKGEIYKKASGNYLTLTESGSHKIKYLDIIGGSRQEVEEGINKAIIPDREETFNGMSINIKNGIINITGKSSVTYTSYRIIGSAELEAGKTYYLRLFGNKSGSVSLRNDTESVWFPDSENNENQFTPTVGGTYNIQLGFGSGENQNWNARYSISETSNADWVEGKEATPTLENPSEVQAVGDSGSVEIKKTNKNWLPYDLFPTTTINGVTFTNNPDGTIKANGTATANAFYRQDVTLQAGDYLLTGSPADAENSKYCIQAMGYGIGDFGEGQSFSLSKETAVPIRLMVWQGVTVNNIIFKPMIESGNSKTEFIKHEGNTYTIPVQKPFYKLGDYADKFVKQDGKWYEQHNIALFDLSTTNWYAGSVQSGKDVKTKRWNSVNTISNYIMYDNEAISNYFSENLTNVLWGTDKIGFNLESNKINIRLPVDTASNETEVKNFWQEKAETQVPYIYYRKATPELIECTSEQTQILEQIVKDGTYKGITHFYTTDDLKPTIELTYYKDLETLFKNQAEIQNTLNNVQAQILELGGN